MKGMGKSNPFKVGDRVYVYPHGWGKVTNDNELVAVQMDGHGPELLFVKEDWRLVSFTEYDPIKGGLSHERVDLLRQLVKDELSAIGRASQPIGDPMKGYSVWSPIQSMTLDALGEKLQEHDRILKGVSGAIDELKKVKVDGKIKLADIWPIRPDFKKRFVSGGTTNECVLSKDQSRYRSLIKDFMSDFDVVGFNAYDELYEAPNKDGSLSPGIPTGRVTLSIDLVRRK